MTTLEIWLLAVGLAMDCFAISIASGILLKRTLWRPMLMMAFFFGLFQALMPLIGWACASTFSHLIEDVDHWIAFAILAFLGGRMVRESFKEEDCRQDFDPTRLKVVLMLAVATSIDALAVGVSFAFLGPVTCGHYWFRFVRSISNRAHVRHPLRMRFCPTPEGRALGRRYSHPHRPEDTHRTFDTTLWIRKQEETSSGWPCLC